MKYLTLKNIFYTWIIIGILTLIGIISIFASVYLNISYAINLNMITLTYTCSLLFIFMVICGWLTFKINKPDNKTFIELQSIIKKLKDQWTL